MGTQGRQAPPFPTDRRRDWLPAFAIDASPGITQGQPFRVAQPSYPLSRGMWIGDRPRGFPEGPPLSAAPS